MLTNFKLDRLKPKLDIVKKPENRVHELTDSNVSLVNRYARIVEQRCQPVYIVAVDKVNQRCSSSTFEFAAAAG